jgi:putative ABC transport system substrate-binding protein
VTGRRRFLLAVALALPSFAARAQPSGRTYRLAMLLPSSPPAAGDAKSASTLIPHGLALRGFVEGSNLVVERRYAEGRFDRLPGLARELVAGKPDVIVTLGLTGTRAAKEAAGTIPIVMYGNIDPIASGLVQSLARPGGNLTAVLIAPDGTLAAKKVELLKQAVPSARRIAFLAPSDPGIALQVDEARKAAARIGLEIFVVTVQGNDYDAAFAAIAAKRPDALFVGANTVFVRDRHAVIERATRHRIPAIYEWSEQVEDGGLMSYGSSLRETTLRVADIVVRIFRGAQPGEIPIEQPTQFRLVVNASAAKAIGLVFPATFLQRVDEVLP